MKKHLPSLVSLFTTSLLVAQTTTTFNPNGTGKTGTVQQYVVPACVSQVTINAYGAQGGNTNGGLGAQIIGTFPVTFGDTLYIAVGQQGTVNNCGGTNASSGGGGGSFVWKSNGPSRTLLVAAGGGGGGNTNWSGGCIVGINAVTVTSGTQGNGALSAMGGTAGAGGFGNAPSGTGSGGAGWLSAGQNSTYGTGCTGGASWPTFIGGNGSSTFGGSGQGDGGFGGGGGAVCGNGGGGGYSGGGGGEGSSCRAGGGGGGSFNGGTNQTNNGGVRTGNGLVTITATPNGSFNVTATFSPNDSVCAGTSVTVSGGNAVSYVWNNSIVNNTPFTANNSMSLQVIGTNAQGCIDTSNFSLHVFALPTVTSSIAPNDSVCAGTSVTLSGNGASTYSWTGNVTNAVSFVPASSATYTVTGTDANGCTASSTQAVQVNPAPAVSYMVMPNDSVCVGESVTLSGSGAQAYVWTGNVTNNVAFTPTATATYNVSGTDATGCTGTASVEVVVNALPVVTVNLPTTIFCLADAPYVLSGESPVGGTWSGTGVSGSIFTPSVAGVGAHWIIYSYTDNNGCEATDSVAINVDICQGLTSHTPNDLIQYWPNPTTGTLFVQWQKETQVSRIDVCDVTGRIVQTITVQNSNRAELNLATLPTGMYQIRVTSDGGMQTYRVVKN